MARIDIWIAAALTLAFVPTASALKCPKEQQTREVYVTLAGCAKVPNEFVITIGGVDRTVTRPDPKVARWHVQVDKPFCIAETNLTSVTLPDFRTACEVKAQRGGTNPLAPVAVFNVPCAPVWALVIEKQRESESRFLYRVNRDPAVSCDRDSQPNDQETVAPDSIGELALRDGVTVSVRMPRRKIPLEVTVQEPVLRTKPNGARFGLLYKSSPARNEQTDLVRDAFADTVDLIFKKQPTKEASK